MHQGEIINDLEGFFPPNLQFDPLELGTKE